ncbi:unnamed protein product [Paramecium primaurelia]|uniref:Major facilitator superfamily (MFS) profile domain-containing protein n=1 Tax=Paramecium primaurelia TaxID=5886 RepID=A0A8S1NE84_PARPR|nr:unnamed protein product [Paramecium primaurelia]
MPIRYVDVLTVEQALIKAGNGHKFQIRAIVIMSLQYMVAGMFHIAITELYFHQTQYKCIDQQYNIYQCNEVEFCKQYYRDDIDKEKITFASQLGDIIQFFQLVCDDKIIILILITSYYLGGCIGSLYYGEQMEIRQGRQSIMIETLALLGFTCCLTILIPNAYLLSVALFFANFFLRGFLNSSMILFFEISSENLQKLSPSILLTAYGIGTIISPVIIDSFQLNWQQSMLILFGGPAVMFSVLIKFMQESPRMLVIKKKYHQAKIVLQIISQCNGREMPKDWMLEDEVRVKELKDKMQEITQQFGVKEVAKGYNFSSIFRYNSTRVRMFCLLYLYSVIIIGQFQTSKEIDAFSRLDRQKTELLLSTVATVGYLISGYASLNYNRKDVLKIVLGVSAMFNFLYAVFPIFQLSTNAIALMSFYDRLMHTIIMMILIMSRLVLSFGCAFINIYALEVFPTSLRHYGFSGMVFLTEFLFIFQETYVVFCHTFGLNTSIGMFFLLLFGILTLNKLRETYDQPLKENVEELNDELLNNVYVL